MSAPGLPRPAEHGDRAAFLARIRDRQGPPPTIGPHPPPLPPEVVPEVRFRALDGLDPADPAALVPLFTAAARAVGAVVHGPGADLAAAVAEVVDAHQVRLAVRSAEPEVDDAVEALRAHGVAPSPYDPATGAGADLGITSAVAGIAATGSVVVDAAASGGRGASLLPTVHLCVLPVARLVASPSDVLRRGPRPLPSNLVLVTGPSRTGDIEQIITLGAHGPVAVHIVLV